MFGTLEQFKSWGLERALPTSLPTVEKDELIFLVDDIFYEWENWYSQHEFCEKEVKGRGKDWVRIKTTKSTVSTNLETREYTCIRAKVNERPLSLNGELENGTYVAVGYIGERPDDGLNFYDWHRARGGLPKVVFSPFGEPLDSECKIICSIQESKFFDNEDEAIDYMLGSRMELYV